MRGNSGSDGSNSSNELGGSRSSNSGNEFGVEEQEKQQRLHREQHDDSVVEELKQYDARRFVRQDEQHIQGE
ncbi:uncharacterized protein EMH_0011420 [Eimeria mitis]|uniref:Uncharacterized protein n=1 Tax=Eimeria mitis TaxID=44415 RepID=U6KJ06_9EIME|nr:uncharacterized protein EMH_0011420 [Eimeria mitis]CDJ36262.1 hypothetical protein EMH_0011420 [Eimeria mitis]